MIYLIIILLLLFLSFQYDYLKKQTGKELFFLVIYVILVLVAGLRYRLGQDTIVYMRFFENLTPLNQLGPHDFENSRFAPGFVMLCSFFRMFGPDFVNFQLFHSFVVTSVFLWFIKRHTEHLFFAIFLFFFYMYFLLMFQQMRESLAASIFLLAWPSLMKRRWLIWFPCCFLAMSFHVSAFFMFILPVIFIPGVRNLFSFSKFTPFVILGFVILGFLIQAYLFKYVQMIAVTEAMMERATNYSRSDLAAATFNPLGLIGKVFQWILYPLLAMIFLLGKKFRNNGQNLEKLNRMENMVVLSLYISSLSISIPILGRYNNYFYIFSILIISDWVFTYVYFNRRKVRLQFFTWLIVFLPMFFFQIQNVYTGPINKSGTLRGYMVYYPYASYLDKDQDEDREKAMRYLIRNVR